MHESLILYKLIILYMLDYAAFPLTNSHITEFIVGRGYTNYFIIQQSFFELKQDRLVKAESIRHSSHYTIAEEGKKTLVYYRHIMTDEIVESIHSYLKENKMELKSKVSILADYEPLRDREYAIHLKIKEWDSYIIDLTVQVPTEELANQMCDNWLKKHEELYAHIMTQLMKND